MASPTSGTVIIAADTAVTGSIRSCQTAEVFGYVEGEVTARNVIVHEGGRVFGKLRAEAAEVHGAFQGQAHIKNLMRIGRTGTVSGNIRYGQLAMELGGELSVEVRNIPPTLFGDLEITVPRGGAVAITLADLTAVDPDSTASELVYRVSNAVGGFVEIAGSENRPAATFTQADLEAARVSFRHDGSAGRTARFDVVVADASGATSGTPQTVQVSVQ